MRTGQISGNIQKYLESFKTCSRVLNATVAGGKICENIQKDIQDRDSINGISISPKKEFNIIKIWFKNNINDLKSINFIEPYITDKNGRTKKNIN